MKLPPLSRIRSTPLRRTAVVLSAAPAFVTMTVLFAVFEFRQAWRELVLDCRQHYPTLAAAIVAAWEGRS